MCRSHQAERPPTTRRINRKETATCGRLHCRSSRLIPLMGPEVSARHSSSSRSTSEMDAYLSSGLFAQTALDDSLQILRHIFD